MTIGVRALKRP